MVSDGTVNSSEVITQEAVRAQFEEIAQENLVFREAFRQVDATGINSGSYEIPVKGDTNEEAGVVSEGSAIPSDVDAQDSKTTISFDKYATGVEITYESVQDSLFDEIALRVEEKARALAEGLDAAAYGVLNSNLNAASPVGSATGDMAYDDVVDAMTTLESDGYEADLLIVSPDSKGDLLKSDDFTRASDMGDEVIRDGAFGMVAGVEVMVSNVGDLGAGEAFLVDSDFYGIEAVREGMNSEEDVDTETQKRLITVWTRMGWAATRAGAAVKIVA